MKQREYQFSIAMRDLRDAFAERVPADEFDAHARAAWITSRDEHGAAWATQCIAFARAVRTGCRVRWSGWRVWAQRRPKRPAQLERWCTMLRTTDREWRGEVALAWARSMPASVIRLQAGLWGLL